jgi:hypothetical protein
MILNETVAAIADAIREKTGKSELIAPVDFASEIKGITAGGGDAPSGGESLIFLDITNSDKLSILAFNPICARIATGIYPASEMGGDYTNANAIAIAPDIKILFVEGIGIISLRELAGLEGATIDEFIAALGATPITKEQFYDLNA